MSAKASAPFAEIATLYTFHLIRLRNIAPLGSVGYLRGSARVCYGGVLVVVVA